MGARDLAVKAALPHGIAERHEQTIENGDGTRVPNRSQLRYDDPKGGTA